MKAQVAFCSACDRDVRIVFTDAPLQDAQAPVGDAEIICLEVGEHCTGNLCPVAAVSPTVMRVRRVRSGVHTVLEPVVRAQCAVCGRVTDYCIVAPEFATCVDCGTTVAREELAREA